MLLTAPTTTPQFAIPGLNGLDPAKVTKSNTYRKSSSYVQSLIDMLPAYQNALGGAENQEAGTQLGIAQQYAPGYNLLGQQLEDSNAAHDTNLLNGAGKDTVQAALNAAKIYDPEYFATRAKTSDELSKLMDSIDLSGKLSGSEQDEIQRSLDQQSMRRGTSGAPSNLDTVSNAMTFGSAGRNRQLQSQDQLTKAISAATQFLPQSKSGVDTFQIATGKSSGTGLGTAALGSGNTGTSNGSNLFGGINQIGNTYLQGSIAQDDNNFGSQFSGALAGSLGKSIGQLGGSVLSGAVGMMCWIAREVYGVNNPKWYAFRFWMFTKAPKWFFNWYAKNGEQVAKYISNKPILKFMIRKIINTILFLSTNSKEVTIYA